MADIKKHQTLIELENMVNSMLVIQTNLAYANDSKYVYKMTWLKGKGAIKNDEGKKTKDYYVLRVYITDKTDIISKEIPVYVFNAPVTIHKSIYALHEECLKGFINNCISAKAFLGIHRYKQEQEELKNPKPIEDVKPAIDLILPKTKRLITGQESTLITQEVSKLITGL